MSKRIIAVDIDDVLMDTAERIIGYYNRTYGASVELRDFYSMDHRNVWNAPDEDTAIRRVNTYLESDDYHNIKPAADAVSVLRQLAERYELHIVTGRADFLEQVTRGWLASHFPDLFKTLTFTNMFKLSDGTGTKRKKVDVCVKIGADYLIEDHLGHAEDVATVGVKVLLFGDYPWNQADSLPANIDRCKDWLMVKEYFDGK